MQKRPAEVEELECTAVSNPLMLCNSDHLKAV